MPLLANNSRFHFDIPSLEEELHVVGFDHEESLSGLFQCRLELACLRHNLPLNNLLAQAGVLTLYDEQHPRLIHGEVARAALGAIGTRYTTYYLTLRPKLWWLTLRSGMRIFEERSVPEILLQVIQDKNRDQGRSPAGRADLRFGSGPDGQVFLLNKRDGVIRLLVSSMGSR